MNPARRVCVCVRACSPYIPTVSTTSYENKKSTEPYSLVGGKKYDQSNATFAFAIRSRRRTDMRFILFFKLAEHLRCYFNKARVRVVFV